MKISDISIHRPVFATVINLIIILLGLVGLFRLSVREYPNIDQPIISVSTSYTGASAEIVETQVTKVLEDAISGIDGIDFISSSTQRGRSNITITFRASRDIEQAANDIRDRVSRAKRGLPDEVDEPIIRKADSDSDPTLVLFLSSNQHSLIEQTKIADTIIRPELELVDGVASVNFWGSRDPIMNIDLDPQQMAIFKLTFADVESALRQQNIEIPSGTIKSLNREFSVVARTDLNTPEEFENIILNTQPPTDQNNSAYLVRLSDIATVRLGSAEEESRTRSNGKPSIGLAVIIQSVANPLTVSTEINQRLDSLRSKLPEGMNLVVGLDNSIFITQSLNAVYRTIVEAVLFVSLIIFLFLRDWRATLIPVITVPVSLIGTLFILYLLGYSINTLTLLAFVLAIGLVVDDAIVVLENIHRHMEKGVSAVQAAMTGTREIGFAVIAMTLTLATVFLPLVFTEGRIGKLFVEFAVTLSVAVIISGFTALTLSPMMAAHLLKPHQQHGTLFNLFENGLNHLTHRYHQLLAKILNYKSIVSLILVSIFVAIYGLFMHIPQMLTPIEDRGRILLSITAPEGSTLDFVDKYVSDIETSLQKNPLIERVTFNMNATGGRGFQVLTDWRDRDTTQMDIVRNINQLAKHTAVGLRIFALNPAGLGQRGASNPVEVVLRSNENYAQLSQQVDQIMTQLMQQPELINPDHDLRLNMPQLEVTVNRDKLAVLGIDVDVVGRSLETALGGRQVTRYKEGSEQYPVIVRVGEELRRQPHDLEGLYVRAQSGAMIPLSNLVTLTETIAPQTLKHFNKMRSITFTANLQTLSQAQGIALVEDIIRNTIPDALIDYSGAAREFKETGSAIYGVFLMAIVFIYLVLAAQFESWRDPFIILFSLPLAGLGALGALALTSNSLNIYSQIGLITLVGLITKHGILIVEFANQLQQQGKNKVDAILESATLRLRPILMTTAAMVLGALPLALGTGAGSESRQTIGWVIVGGMTVGTFLTLFIVPTIYLIISSRKNRGEI